MGRRKRLLGRLRLVCDSVAQTCRLTLLLYRADDCMRSAAAISYYALLSLLPFLILILSALGFVMHALGADYSSQEEFIQSVFETTGHVLPFIKEDLAQRLRELIDARGAMGIVGLVALALTSSLVFGAIEDALNRIFGVNGSRHLLVSKLLFIGFIGSLGVFAVTSHYVLVFADSFAAAAGGRPLHEYLYTNVLFGKLLAYAGTLVGFLGLVTYFCRRRLRFKYLVVGASLFFLLFELAKWVFSFYLEHIAQLSTLYGSLSTFVVLIVWTFYTICIFLASVVVVKVLNDYGFWALEPDEIALETIRVSEVTGLGEDDVGPGE
ncbi:MAG: YihY/virulence factor BrkB family protein [Deltaproteobacteria bacterium]|nr:YihY/virulence factor BrkB family protein [Deltaproteobacteria bacterium]